MEHIQRVGSREVYRNSWMTLREDDIRGPDGSTGIYAVIDKPTYALVIPCDGDRFHLVEQYRYPLGLRRWEFPQGTAPDQEHLDPGETSAEQAALGLPPNSPGTRGRHGTSRKQQPHKLFGAA